MRYRQHIFSNVKVEENLPAVADILENQIAKYMNIYANNCGYSATAEEIIVNYVHTLKKS